MYNLMFPIRHEYPTDARGIVVEVLLQSKGQEFRTPAKVDTGAEFCLFSRDIAEALDIEVEAGLPQRMSTLGGPLETYGHEITYSVLGVAFTGMVYFVASEQEFPRNVLGRRGWLDRLRIGIVEYDRHLLIADYNS